MKVGLAFPFCWILQSSTLCKKHTEVGKAGIFDTVDNVDIVYIDDIVDIDDIVNTVDIIKIVDIDDIVDVVEAI